MVGLENISDVNKTISIPDSVQNQNFSVGRHFSVAIVNTSDDVVKFPYDYSIKLLMLEDGEWVELENNVQHVQKTDVLLAPFSDGGLAQTVINPSIPEYSEGDVQLRVVVSGTLEENDVVRVGAYIDLVLVR